MMIFIFRSIKLSTSLIALLCLNGCQTSPSIKIENQPFQADEDLPFSFDTVPEVENNDKKHPFISIKELNLDALTSPPKLRLNVDDVIKFFVWKHPELTHITTVQPDGTIALPLIGRLDAVNKQTDEIQAEATKILAKISQKPPLLRFQFKDQIKMEVWQELELTHTAEVQMDGMATFPLVGEIKALGRSISEIRQEIRQKLKKYLLDPAVSILPEKIHQQGILNPKISILPIKLRSRKIAVIGEVDIEGVQPLKGTLQVMQALATSQPKISAQLNEIILLRHSDIAESQVYYKKLRLQDYMDGKITNQDVYLKTGDIIYVPQTTISKVGNFVNHFFNGTRGVFDWWVMFQNAQYSRRNLQKNININDSLINSIRGN